MIWSWLRTSKQMKKMLRFRTQQTQALSSVSCYWQFPQKSKNNRVLNSDSVHSTLSRCPSDLIALSFFLWSAQRRNHDPLAFDHMVPVLSRLTHRYKTVQAILSKLESIGCLTNPKSFIFLLRLFWRAGMHAMLFEAYHHMEQSYGFVPNTFARNLLMDALFRINQPNLALTVFEHIQTPNFFTFNIALVHLSKLNDVTRVTRILRLMLRTRYYPNALSFHIILNCFCNMNALLEAYQLLGLMIVLGIEFSVNVWTILIHKYCKLGRLDVATGLLQNMTRTGCSPNVVTYTTLFKALMESNMVNDAFHLLNIMFSTGQIPDLILFNVLIDCLSKAGRYGDAIEAFLSMSEQNIKPDSYTFTSLLSIICSSGMFYLLPKLVRVCGHIDADLVFCNALLSSFIKAGHPSHAVGFYNHMIDEGFAPDKYSFAGLLGALCAARRIDEAVNVYHGVVMSYHNIDAHIHTVITGELMKAGKYHKAASVFKLAVMKKYRLDNVAYAVGIYAHLRRGRTLEACTLYGQMKDNGLKPNVHTCNMMLFTFCKEKDLQMVKEMLEEMIDSRIELSDRNFFNLCKFPCRSNAYFSALNLLTEMRDLGLLSAKALHALSFDRYAEGEKATYEHCAEVNTEWNIVPDLSSSEDLSDVAASVC
ncbi:Tetratricopeptide-like helical domain superfamily [Sesbania bispinosa]|nr:Tetratricopeptide-like helical domain superfamily [Sesbania bispinosa]